MYGLSMPVSRIRTKLREEFERHRYVAQLPTVDVLLAQSNMEFQVWLLSLVLQCCGRSNGFGYKFGLIHESVKIMPSLCKEFLMFMRVERLKKNILLRTSHIDTDQNFFPACTRKLSTIGNSSTTSSNTSVMRMTRHPNCHKTSSAAF